MSQTPERPTISRRFITPVIACCTILLSTTAVARAVTGSYRVAMIQTAFTDSSGIYTRTQLDAAGGEIAQYFRDLSYRNLDMQIRVADVRLSGTAASYLATCTISNWSGCSRVVREAAELAAVQGVDLSNVDAILIATAASGTDFTLPSAVGIPSVARDRSFFSAIAFEGVGGSAASAPGPSAVQWGSWAHELGHVLELAGRIPLDTPWLGHPSSYTSGYDLMDSCYPCNAGAFSLLATAASRGVFPGWLPNSKVVTVEPGSPGTTVVLAPLSVDPSSTPAPQVIKVPIAPGNYYLVEVRRRMGTDALDRGRGTAGIWDEGVKIQRIDEAGNPPAVTIDACDYTVPGGCVRTTSDLRAGLCRASSGRSVTPSYCWPFDLWHGGQSFTDTVNGVRIGIDREVGNGYSVTVTRGTVTRRPDMYLLPWLTPPMNTWESVDIWVDSSCNGYESVVGPSGLREGRRIADGTVIGNGDDPCVGHRNRVYARVRNRGDAAATDVRVRFLITDPPGVGIRDASGWTEIGTATQAEFPVLASLPPGGAADVYVEWTPRFDLTEEAMRARRFAYHTCLQVRIDPVAGETLLSNQDGQGEQENILYFEARQSLIADLYTPASAEFYLRNLAGSQNEPAGRRQYELITDDSGMPADWQYVVGDGSKTLVLEPGEVRRIPVKVLPPPDAPAGLSYSLAVRATTNIETRNLAAETSGHGAGPHVVNGTVAGVVLTARTVKENTIDLQARNSGTGQIQVSGRLASGAKTYLTLDITAPDGKQESVLLETASGGAFSHAFSPRVPGKWTLAALFQGDRLYSSAVSSAITVAFDK